MRQPFAKQRWDIVTLPFGSGTVEALLQELRVMPWQPVHLQAAEQPKY